MESRRTTRSLFLLALLPLLGWSAAAPAAVDLVTNPFFNADGDDPVPGWTVMRIAGKTSFRLESGVLVAERKSGTATAADSLTQMVLLPEGVRALRVAVRAAPARISRAEIELRFIRLDGGPGGRKTLFRLSGSHAMRDFEKDVLLPEDTHNVELAIRVYTPGKLLVDSASVTAIAPEEIRAEARFVTARARFSVPPAGDEGVESVNVSLPIPPITATQCPVSLEVRSEPDGRVQSSTVRRENGHDRLDLVVGPLEPGFKVRLTWTARLFLTDLEREAKLPATIPISPSRHLPRRIAALAAPPEDEETLGFAKRAGTATTDLMVVAERATRARSVSTTPGGRAHLAAAVFRLADVPAVPMLLIPIGGPGRKPAVLAYHPQFDWLRFGLASRDPLPESRGVLIPVGAPPVYFEPLEGLSGGPAVDAVETGNLTLQRGAAADLIAALSKAWEKATRRADPDFRFAIEPGRLSLRGAAKKLKPTVVELIGK